MRMWLPTGWGIGCALMAMVASGHAQEPRVAETGIPLAGEQSPVGLRLVAAPPHRFTMAEISLPATFSGSLPCADCAAQRYTVTLRNDHTYLARRTYLQAAKGKDQSFYEIGRWSLENGGTRLLLHGGKKMPEQFFIKDARTIRKLDNLGHQIISRANHDLRRAVAVDPIAESFRMNGEYTYAAGNGVFTECVSGARFPVAAEEDAAALERAYGAAGMAPGAALLATLDGRLAHRATADGKGQAEKLVVERFDRVWPQERCASRAPAENLAGTYWRLTELSGQRVIALSDSREPHLILQANGHKLVGSGGCNRLLGSYELSGEQLRVTLGGTTRMACPAPLINQELAFFEALRATTRYRIQGDALELRGGQRLLARLHAQDVR